MDYLEYKGYKGSVEYSKDDNCLFGKVQGLSKELITYETEPADAVGVAFPSSSLCCFNRHHYQRFHQSGYHKRTEESGSIVKRPIPKPDMKKRKPR